MKPNQVNSAPPSPRNAIRQRCATDVRVQAGRQQQEGQKVQACHGVPQHQAAVLEMLPPDALLEQQRVDHQQHEQDHGQADAAQGAEHRE